MKKSIKTTDELIDKDNYRNIFKTIIGFNEKGKIDVNYIQNILKLNIDEYCIEKTNDGHRKYYEAIHKKIKNFKINYKKTDLKKQIEKKLNEIYDFTKIDESGGISKHYKFCHIWGYSRNPWLNCAYWNTWFVPYIYAELTEENKCGKVGEKLRKELKKEILNNKTIRKYIEDYNNTIYSKLYNDDIKDILNKKYTYKDKNGVHNVKIKNIIRQFILINMENGSEQCLFEVKDNFVELSENIDKRLYGIEEKKN